MLEGANPVIVHQLIRFLAHDRFAFFAMDHLRRALPSRVGQLADALLDPDEDFAVRKRIPIILASSDSQRALDDLLLALTGREFVVRFRCATAMSQIRARRPDLYVSQERIWQVLDERLTNEMKITVIATGFDKAVAAVEPSRAFAATCGQEVHLPWQEAARETTWLCGMVQSGIGPL